MKDTVNIISDSTGSSINLNLKNKDLDYKDSVISIYSSDSVKNKSEEYSIRSFKIYGTQTELNNLLNKYSEKSQFLELPGRIVVSEFLTSEVLPEKYYKQLVAEKTLTRVKGTIDLSRGTENQYNNHLKRDSKKELIKTKEGENVLVFFEYDPTNTIQDKLIDIPAFSDELKIEVRIVTQESKIDNQLKTSSVDDVVYTKYKYKVADFLIIISVIVGIIIGVIYSSVTLPIIGFSIFLVLTYLYGSIFKHLLAPNSRWSIVLIIIVGIIGIYLLGTFFEGCGGGEPDSGWRKP